ncbi:DUF4190 domain-containing protein [Actinoplanes solisilvae]|uniref:DUF4190 domain-containing protein n=1 Tax=Actinoplanes solisilvae TaxID=2486853 RepID=UPI0013E304A2|nr:DUF4190 domain-containing protein [Actinoplanes solisilvae]
MIHPSSPSEPPPDGQPTTPLPADPTAPLADPTAPPAAYTPPTTAFPPPTTAFPPPTTAFPPPPNAFPPPPAYAAPPPGYPQAPQPYTDPYAGYAPPPPPPATGTNGFAIAALILGILGGGLLGIIFGIVALVQIKKRPQGGRGLAIAGLVISGVWLLVYLVACGFAIASDDGDDKAANSVGSGNNRVSVYNLREGDCVGDLGDKDTVYDVPVVKCSVSHEGEVFGTFELPTGAWPGEDKVYSLADAGCAKRLDSYASGPVDDLEYFPLTPVKSEWPKDRGVTCIATDPSGPRTTSLRD